MAADFSLDENALRQIVDMLEQQFGSHCEVVLHDLSKPYDQTIVDIRNGYITGRSIGDCGSNLGLEVIRGTVKNGDKYNYFTHTRDGKVLRSSSIYLKDTLGQVRYSLCVNVDITDSVKFENYLREANKYEIGEHRSEEVFVSNVGDLLDYFLDEGRQFIGKDTGEMNKDEKMKLLEFLDRKGAFLISKSGEKVCEVLGISKFTFYNYLETIRKNSGHNGKLEDS